MVLSLKIEVELLVAQDLLEKLAHVCIPDDVLLFEALLNRLELLKLLRPQTLEIQLSLVHISINEIHSVFTFGIPNLFVRIIK